MSSIEETAHPRLPEEAGPLELEQLYTPTAKERACVKAKEALRRPMSRACAMLQLKLMQRLGYSVPLANAPLAITVHACRKLKVSRRSWRGLRAGAARTVTSGTRRAGSGAARAHAQRPLSLRGLSAAPLQQRSSEASLLTSRTVSSTWSRRRSST